MDIEAKAREVAAWVSSGNSVPVELADYLRANHPGFWVDLVALQSSLKGA